MRPRCGKERPCWSSGKPSAPEAIASLASRPEVLERWGVGVGSVVGVGGLGVLRVFVALRWCRMEFCGIILCPIPRIGGIDEGS